MLIDRLKAITDPLIEILDYISQVCKFWDKLPKSKQPQSKSYRTVQEALNNHFTSAKRKFFSFVSDVVESCLKNYQAGEPITPSMFQGRKQLMSTLLKLFTKSAVLEENMAGKK